MHSVLLVALVSLFVAPNAQAQTIPAEFTTDGRVIVTATVNGKPMRLHLDSGTGGVLIDTAAARAAGLPDAKGDATATIDIGAFHAANAPVFFKPYAQHLRELRLSGILGAPFFESNVVTIDYPHKRVIVTPHEAFDPSALHAAPTTLLELYRGLAKVPVWIDGLPMPARMLLDTGADETMVLPAFANRAGLKLPVSTSTACGGARQRCYAVDNYATGPIVVGNTEIRKVLIGVPQQAVVSPKYYDGILGRDILQAFVVTFDYADNAVYFSLPQ